MKELIAIQQELNAPKNQRNNFGNYNYRSCEDILEAVKPLLKKNDCHLLIYDDIVEVGGRVYVKATVTLSTSKGDVSKTATAFAREPVSKKGMDDCQLTGATSSYARKYALNGLFLIDDSKDADTTTYERDIAKEINDCKSQAELTALWTGLAPATQMEYKGAFSDKKGKL